MVRDHASVLRFQPAAAPLLLNSNIFTRTSKLMAGKRLLSFSFRDTRLTADEFASLKEIGNRPMQRTIPDEHRDRLILGWTHSGSCAEFRGC